MLLLWDVISGCKCAGRDGTASWHGGRGHPSFKQLPLRLCVFSVPGWPGGAALGFGGPGCRAACWDLPSWGRIMLLAGPRGWQGLEDHNFGCHWGGTWELCTCWLHWDGNILLWSPKPKQGGHSAMALLGALCRGGSTCGWWFGALGAAQPWSTEGLTLDSCCSGT